MQLADKVLELLRIRREELPLASLVTAYFFLAMASVSLVKSVQNAFYLGRVGFDWRLPLLYVVLAAISGLGVLLYRHLAQRHSRVAITGATLVVLIASLGGFVFLFQSGSPWVYTAFYLWGGIFSVLVPTQGWMLAYQLYATRRAKRIFGILGTGGILGGASGGYYAAWVASSELAAQQLLAHVAVILAMMVVLIVASSRMGLSEAQGARLEQNGDSPPEGIRSSLRFIRQSPYLSYLAGIILVSAAVTTVVDLLYKNALEDRFAGSPGEITQFFGGLLGTIFLFSALFQLLGTNRVIRRLGIGAGLLALPLALLGANVLVIVVGAFWTVVGMKIADGCLRSSLHRTSVELLYVPITDGRTLTVKGILDLAVFRLGDGLGAAVFLGLAALPGSSLHWVAAGTLLLTLAWGALSWLIGGEYVQVLRRSLEVRPTRSARRALEFPERVAERTLLDALGSDRPAKVRFALRQLMEHAIRPEDIRFQEDFSDGSELSQSDEVVMPHFAATRRAPLPPWIDAVTPLLEHDDPDVAATALQLLMLLRPEEYQPRLERQCSGRGIPDQLCLHYLERFGAEMGAELSTKTMLRWALQANAEQAPILARLMGKLGRREFLAPLLDWARDDDRETARCALRALGRYRDPSHLNLLLDALEPLWSRPAAREALVAYGPSIVPKLAEILLKGDNLEVRREIPKVLSELRSEASVEALMSALCLDPIISYRALKGLNKMRANWGLPFGERSFSPALQTWVREYYELLNLDILLEDGGGRARRLVRKAVRERLDRCTEKIFRGLELFLPPGDAYFSYLGFTGEAPGLKENAIELIDLRIRGELRETILPIVTGYNQREVVESGRELYQLPSDLDRVLSDVLFLADPWLKCCIIAAVRAEGKESLRPRVLQAGEDVNPLVRETAQWALETWEVS